MAAGLTPRLIKTEDDYSIALREVRRLMENDPDPESPDGRQLELLAHLVEHYESRTFRIPQPTPLDALKFRMEQQGLSPRDLVPYFGSRARVSEVLSGKRPLNLQMLQTLHSALSIPAESLIRDAPATILSFEADATREEVSPTTIRRFLVRGSPSQDRGSRLTWIEQVLLESRKFPRYPRALSTDDIRALVREVVKLSARDDGPRAAVDHLRRHGIAVVIVPASRATRLDGAALRDDDGRRVIGLTIRHDRLDHFWYTLVHELSHHRLHLDDANDAFLDDMDAPAGPDAREEEADAKTRNALIPDEIWRLHDANVTGSKVAVLSLARQLGISPSIVAGRVRRERRRHRLFTTLVGHGAVRSCFPEVTWGP